MPVAPFQPIRRLRTRLVLAYLGVTVSTLGVLLAALWVGALVAFASNFGRPDELVSEAKPFLPALCSLLGESGTANPTALQETMDAVRREAEREASREVILKLQLAVVNPAGKISASSPIGAFRMGAPMNDVLMAEELSELSRGTSETPPGVEKSSVASLPIIGRNGRPIGTLLMRIHGRLQPSFWVEITRSIMPFALAMLVAGSLCAWAIAAKVGNGLALRLEHLSAAAQAWRRGDLQVEIPRSGNDELGVLAEQLNAMAKDLRELLSSRERLASALERERMARDLHDTVKQHTFAASMHLASAQRQIPEDTPGAEHVRHGAALVENARRDLAEMLVQAPPEMTRSPLAPAVAQRTWGWAKHTAVEPTLDLDEAITVDAVDLTNLLRIVDEALANVDRHSRATRVEVLLRQADGRAELAVQDNGVGLPEVGRENLMGMGLRNMELRANGLPAGSFRISGARGDGVCIVVGWRASRA